MGVRELRRVAPELRQNCAELRACSCLRSRCLSWGSARQKTRLLVFSSSSCFAFGSSKN